ncbi:LexA family protein [Nitrospirillum amazonense]|uniref:LexA family protein n=1 Tax=Nitrospirillum amazonense TaxID=28077 RepID=UPI002412E041|nr:translesion error-prone DNA polymerase V autoproteolytic subunit [Nitrospirillum amazonense]MDG3444574.1 translesion error-prone DNA polymerase V autoproteolytic subunit [Nitrospirillum amazonense]
MQIVDLVFGPHCRDVRFFVQRAGCGFPSPAADYIEERLSLDRLLVKEPAATFFLRVNGTSMRRAGIHPSDIIVCDRSSEARVGDIVVATVDAELVVKRLVRGPAGGLALASEPFPEDEAHLRQLVPREGSQIDIWGKVTAGIHLFRRLAER